MLKRADRNRHEVACSACAFPVGPDFAFCPHCGAAKVEQWVSPENQDAPPDDLKTLFDLPSVSEPIERDLADRSGRNRRALVASFVAIALVLAGIGGWSWMYFRDGPSRAALDQSQSLLVDPIAALAEAETLEELHTSATSFENVLPDLESERSGLDAGTNDLSRAAAMVLEARIELATAGSAVADVTLDDFSPWGDVHSGLMDAVAALESSRQELAEVDGDRANGLQIPSGLVSGVESVVGEAMLAASGQEFVDLFKDLEAAADTSDLRAVGAGAESMGAAISVAIGGFEQGSDQHDQLSGFVALDQAMSGLTSIDADHLADWREVRGDITSAAAAVTSADVSLSPAAASAVGQVDVLVREAQQRLRAWRADYRTAAEAKRTAMSALVTYRDGMTSQLDRYSELRSSLSDWIDRVEDPSAYVTYSEAYDVLWRAEMDRQDARDAMAQLPVPVAISGVHNDLVSVVDDGIAGVAAAYEGISDANSCTTSCYYADTPGWQKFRSASSRITDSYAKAIERWDRAMSQAEAAAENRQLPAPPEI